MAKKKSGITDEMLKNIQRDLKELNIGWVKLIIDKVKADTTVDKKTKKAFNDRKVYNVFNGVIKNGALRLLMYKHGAELKEELEGMVSEVVGN